jgi:uncharacterized protein
MKKSSVLFLLLFSILKAVAQRDSLCVAHYFTENQALEHILNAEKNIYKSEREHLQQKNIWRKNANEILRFQSKKSIKIKPSIYKKVKDCSTYVVYYIQINLNANQWLSGNLYLPKNLKKKAPAILNPHGHFEQGRIQEYMQQRCGTLARMGCIAFSYDLVGYTDAQYIEHKNPEALHIQTQIGKTALDFLFQHPYVDRNRIGITGESGGGTQTMLLTALDDRIKASAPVVMCSAHFFGGCVCESGLPIHRVKGQIFSNLEIASFAAPRPQILVSIGADWTKNSPDLEYPFLQKIYAHYGNKKQVYNEHFKDEKHDFGPSKRKAVYHFFNEVFSLGYPKTEIDAVIDESKNCIVKPELLKRN